MIVVLNILVYLCLYAGVRGSSQISWLSCQFSDSREVKKDDGQNELEFIDREAMLQFDQKGDAPLNPRAITFLVTGSKLDLRQYLNEVEPDEIECALRWYNTQGIHVRWPVQGASEFNYWFSCTLKHKKDLFKLTSFLRHPSEQPPSEQNYQRMPIITDGEVLITSVAMVMKTQTPSLIASLGAQKILHCQFAIDHKGPNVSVEWHKRGERTKLFSHTSHKRKTEGSGVELKRLAVGDASYHIAFTKISNEGKHVCSVSVIPLFADLEISLRIEEAPRVSLNVDPRLSLQVGKEQKFACEAEHYYPLEVDIVWYKEDPAVGQKMGSLLPNMIPNTLLSGHKQNSDRTYSLTSFFYLTASLSDSGKRFTCSVSHQSLRVAIKKSFILTVEEPSSWISTSFMVLILLTLMLILFVSLRILHQASRKSVQKKPY